MVAGALGVSFRQALRSVSLTLFPLAFISLFTWASAGSTSGNTSDPVRASAWLFLGAHLIPLAVPSGKLTVLPLLAVIYPMWAIRRGVPTVEAAFSKINGARLVYSFWYASLCELLALISIHNGISANLYLTPIMTFLIAMIATLKFDRRHNRTFYFSLYLFSIVLGFAALAFAFSLYSHWSDLKSISIVLSGGVVGGILLTLLQLLYLPNIALATLSYLTGIGFSFGSHSTINASHVVLGQVPALPFVSALPTGIHKELSYTVGLWGLFFILIFVFTRRGEKSILRLTRIATSQGIKFFLVVAAVSYFSAGELLTSNLNPVGVIWWRFVAYLAATFFCAAIVVLYIPALVRRVLHHG